MTFPPYGLINEAYMKSTREYPDTPVDWVPQTPGRPPADDWKEARAKLLQKINEVLWPRFDPATGNWNGPSTSFMLPLTEADLEINVQMIKDGVLDRPVRSNPKIVHRELFFEEDGAIMGKRYNLRYDETLPRLFAVAIPQIFDEAQIPKLGMAIPWFKLQLQRPRAYQTAVMLQFPGFIYEQALSADTPAMLSGHCLEGIVQMGAVMEQLLVQNAPLTPNQWYLLQQLAADIGDRRVMAGVHYPSDNICSWFVAMSIADNIYRRTEVKGMLWKAIEQSIVYKYIQESKSAGTVYAPALEALRNLRPRTAASGLSS